MEHLKYLEVKRYNISLLKSFYYKLSAQEEGSTVSKKEELARIKKLMYQGYHQKVIDKIEVLEAQELLYEDQKSCQLLKSTIFMWKGQFKAALNLVHQVSEDKKLDKQNKQKLEALNLKSEINYYIGNISEAITINQEVEQLIGEIDQDQQLIYKGLQAATICIKGRFQFVMGDYLSAIENLTEAVRLQEEQQFWPEMTLSLAYLGMVYGSIYQIDLLKEYAQKTLRIAQQNEFKQGKVFSFFLFGGYHLNGGNLKSALENYQKALMNAKELQMPILIGFVAGWLGYIYYQMGEIKEALKSLQESRNIFEKLEAKGFELAITENYLGLAYNAVGDSEAATEAFNRSYHFFNSINSKNFILPLLLINLVNKYLDLGNLEQARQFRDELKELAELTNLPLFHQAYLLTQGMLLKASKRMRDKMKGLEIFQKIADEEVLYYVLTIFAITLLCDLLVEEIRYSEDSEVFEELKIMVTRLAGIAKDQHIPFYINSFILQSKISLLEMDLEKAQALLEEAQQMATEKGLKNSSMMIAIEQEILENQLSKWKEILSQNPSYNTLIDLTQMEKFLDQMLINRMFQKEEEIRTYATHARQLVERWDKASES